MKNLLSITDFSPDEITELLDSAAALKDRHKTGIPHHPLRSKTLGLIFEKPSTRTRVSFETAIYHLGGDAIFISHRDSQIGRGEPIKDTARVMSRYVDAIVIRTFGHEIIEEYASFSTIPVINGLTDLHHPCQVLADLLTIKERRGGFSDLTVAWIGDGNNMANSWIEAAASLGFKLRLACPKGYLPSEDILAAASNADVELVDTVTEAASGADVLNTDVWASMGQESETDERLDAFKGYQINDELLKSAKDDAIVLHCLPAHRGEEITDAVIEGAHSVVWDQAENRLHIQKAILELLMTDPSK
ncbi:MAG: ornithine carbamoyltransferase [Thermodesulfobacteriota bacterium]